VRVAGAEAFRRQLSRMGTQRPEKPREEQSTPPRDSPAGKDATEKPSWLAIGLVVLLATLPYLNTFPNKFAFDDSLAVVENPQIKNLGNIPLLFKSGYWAHSRSGGMLYRPLVTTSYALNYALGGLNPFGYHLVNLVAHLGVSLLLYGLSLRLFRHREAALVAAALFAVHPLHTEAVTGIVGRAEMFAACFFLLAWWWHLEGQGRPGRMTASVAAFALALLSKENGLALPGVLLLSDVCTLESPGEERRLAGPLWAKGLALVRRYAGYLAVLVAYGFVRTAVFGKVGPGLPALIDNPLAHVGPVPRFLTALEVAGRYLWLMLWPQHLSADYSYNQIPVVHSPWTPGVLLAGLAWAGLIALAWRSARGTRRALLCVGFTLITFLPTSNLLLPIGTIMGERLFYLPSAGLCLLAGVAWQRVWEWRRDRPGFARARWVGLGVVTAAVLLFAARTVARNRDWRDQASLFLSAVRVAPDSAKVRFNLGGVYLEKEQYDDAMRELQASLAIFPSALPHRNLGTLYLRKGQPQTAIAEYRKALELDPRDGEAYNNLGYVLLGQGSIDEATQALETAVILEPTLADAHYTLGRARAEQEHWPEAVGAYQEARRLKPDFVEATYALGLALEASGQFQEAAQMFEDVLRQKPGLKAAHRRLGELYQATLGAPEKAREHLREAGEGK
jgi:tetratricopeptide (TPR) repeat protein